MLILKIDNNSEEPNAQFFKGTDQIYDCANPRNWIQLVYQIFDFLILIPIIFFVNYNDLKTKLKSEIGDVYKEEDKKSFVYKESFVSRASMINSRVAILVAHVSIMLVVLIFLFPLATTEETIKFLTIEFCLYLFVAAICLRCLKSYDFNVPINKDNDRTINDLALRYAAYRFINLFTIMLTLALAYIVASQCFNSANISCAEEQVPLCQDRGSRGKPA